jgi:acyl-CoA synthetase (AMP-forming)/AMP-acid ligase II
VRVADNGEVLVRGYSLPRYLEFRDALPLTGTGKVMKDRLVAAAGRRPAPPATRTPNPQIKRLLTQDR